VLVLEDLREFPDELFVVVFLHRLPPAEPQYST
jgi:hypothetical protein